MSMYAYFKVSSLYVGEVVVFAETQPGFFGALISDSTSTRVNTTGTTLKACAVTLASGKYVSGWTAYGQYEKVNNGILIMKNSGGGNPNTPYSPSMTSSGVSVTIKDEHGTHVGSPNGTYNAYYSTALGVLHQSTDSGWTFKGWKVTLSHSSSSSYGQVLSTGGSQSGNTYTFDENYGAAVLVQCGSSSLYPITIEALYSASTYTVHYDANGGSGAPSDQTANVGSNWTCSSTVPTKQYRTFLGWSKSASATTATYLSGQTYSSLTSELGATVNLYAVWQEIKPTVTFNANGGSVSTKSKQVTCGQQYGTLPTPTWADHTFVGWFTSATSGTQVTASTTVTQQSNHTLYAHWTNAYVLKYDANGGQDAPPSQTFVSSVTIATQKPTYQYHTFLGWSKSSGATTPSYYGGQTYTFTGSTTLYAVWGEIRVTVTFNANGGTTPTSSKSVVVGQAYGTLPTPTYGSYIFFGWYTARTGGTVVLNTTVVTSDQSHTLYAVWGSSSGYALSYDTSSQTGCYFRTLYLFGDCGATATGLPDGVSLCPSCSYVRVVDARNTKAGYVCPQYSQVMNTAYYSNGIPISATGSIGSSQVVISTNGSKSGRRPVRGVLNSCVYSPNTMTLAFDVNALKTRGYKPFGWFVVKREPWAPKVIGDYFVDMTGGSMKSTATTFTLTDGQYLGNSEAGGWQDYAILFVPLVRKLDVVVVFNPNGGQIAEGTYFKRVYYGEGYGTLPTATYEGHSLVGWFTEKTGGTQVTSSTLVSQTEEHVLYAHWRVTTASHNLLFFPCGGTCSETSRAVVEGTPYGTLPTATKTGYNFVGWFTGTVKGVQVSSTTLMGEDDVCVYARWTARTIQVTFNPNGGSVVEPTRQVPYGSQLGTLPVPTYEGKNFLGWFTAATGGTEVTSQTVPSSPTTYYAQWGNGSATWTIVKYKIKLVTNGGTVAGSYGELKYVMGVEKALPTKEQVSRSGYVFDGWFAKADFSGAAQTVIPSTAKNTKTYYAKWREA